MSHRLECVALRMWWAGLCGLFWLAGSGPVEAGLGVWTQGQPSIAPNIFRAVVVDPTTPATLYAATSHIPTAGSPGRQIFKSTDGGSTWVEKPVPGSRAISSLAVDPLAPGTVYAGALFQTGFAAEVFKSTDGGDTWASMSTDLPDAGAKPSVLALTVHPHIPGTVFASTGNGLFKSTDGASSWAALSTGLCPTGVFPCTTPGVTLFVDHQDCVTPGAPLNALAQPTFSVFVLGTGGPIAFDPAANRIFVRFRDQLAVTRGGTSVAVRTR